jgi:8-oxo-dGTP pyrophosphatase MutT (NUDIX family)
MAQTIEARLSAMLRGRRSHEAAGTELIWAAVGIIIAPDPDSILLIRRAERDGDPWSGQMALPGGRRDLADADLEQTARRETEEEVGITLAPGSSLGALDDFAPSTPTLPPVAVRPFIFHLDHRPALTLSDEVDTADWVLLDQLRDPGGYFETTVVSRGVEFHRPAYHLPCGVVWGLTERLLTQFLELL